MTSLAYTPDLFADQPNSRPPVGVTEGPDVSHEVPGWRDGWWFRENSMAEGALRAYDPQVLAWIRGHLEGGAMDYMDLLQARRDAKTEPPFHVADIVRSHVRYLVLAGEIIEHKRYFGSPSASDPGYRGWHPHFELTEGGAA